MKYQCEKCNYETDRLTNLNRHIKSSIHNSVKQMYYCSNCNISFTRNSSLIRHIKNICPNQTNEIILLNNKIKELEIEKIIKEKDIEKFKLEREKDIEIEKLKIEKENIRLEERLKSTETINEFLIKDKQHNEFIQKENAQIIKTGMNALSFVRTQFYNAPPIHYYKKANNLFDHKKNTKGEVIVNYFKKKKLVKYIGNEIIKEYKKSNPHEQALWSSDVVRKNMLYNKQMNNNKTKWIQDKSGIDIASYAIDPIIKTIRTHTDPLKDVTPNNILDNKVTEMAELAHRLDDYIDNNNLKNDIISFISPRIFLDKDKIFVVDKVDVDNKDNGNIQEDIVVHKQKLIKKKSKKNCLFIKPKKKLIDRNGNLFTPEEVSSVDSDIMLEAIIGRKLKK